MESATPGERIMSIVLELIFDVYSHFLTFGTPIQGLQTYNAREATPTPRSSQSPFLLT